MRALILAAFALALPTSSACAKKDIPVQPKASSVVFTALHVRKLDSSLAFYKAVFGLIEKMRHEGGEEVEVGIGASDDTGQLPIMLVARKDGTAEFTAPAMPYRIALSVTKIEEMCDRAARHGGAVVKPVINLEAYHTKIAFVTDPDGNMIELFETSSK